MSYHEYPEYAESGPDWLGSLPRHWSSRRLRFAAAEPLMYGANEAAVLDDQALPRYIRITDVKADGTLHDDTFRSLEEDVAAPYLLQDGDILLARSGATVGKSFQYLASWGRAAYAGYLIRCRPDKGIIFPRFANYYFQTECYWACIRSTLIQATIENFSAEKYKDLTLPLPTKEEQMQIAAFLDWKTGQIDGLIGKKKELLEKLKEKRLAVITQAVTRGLNPTAPLKDSGIPWLGQVPKHWEVKRLKFVFPRLYSGVSVNSDNSPSLDGSTAILKTSCVYGNCFKPEENKRVVETELERVACPVTRDSLIISRMNTPELVGNCGYIERDYEYLFLPDRLWIAHFLNHPDAKGKFAWYLVTSHALSSLTGILATGTSDSMKNLTQEAFLDIKVGVPPVPEQAEIAAFLDEETEKLDALEDKVLRALETLREYRTALITAATTGKIDVRNVNIPNMKMN